MRRESAEGLVALREGERDAYLIIIAATVNVAFMVMMKAIAAVTDLIIIITVATAAFMVMMTTRPLLTATDLIIIVVATACAAALSPTLVLSHRAGGSKNPYPRGRGAAWQITSTATAAARGATSPTDDFAAEGSQDEVSRLTRGQ